MNYACHYHIQTDGGGNRQLYTRNQIKEFYFSPTLKTFGHASGQDYTPPPPKKGRKKQKKRKKEKLISIHCRHITGETESLIYIILFIII
jgi:hypothetical protein